MIYWDATESGTEYNALEGAPFDPFKKLGKFGATCHTGRGRRRGRYGMAMDTGRTATGDKLELILTKLATGLAQSVGLAGALPDGESPAARGRRTCDNACARPALP